jgi:predicted RNase H-like HicB family nuclease
MGAGEEGCVNVFRFFLNYYMHNEFTMILEEDGGWFIAYSPEIPGANGQGRTREEAQHSLSEAIELILLDRREDAL